jgi:hypothetical protein
MSLLQPSAVRLLRQFAAQRLFTAWGGYFHHLSCLQRAIHLPYLPAASERYPTRSRSMRISFTGMVMAVAVITMAGSSDARVLPDFVVHGNAYSVTQEGAQNTAMYNAGMQCAQAGAGVRSIVLQSSGGTAATGYWATAMAVCGGPAGSGEMPGPE